MFVDGRDYYVAMWPFKESLIASRLPLDGPWSVAEETYDGKIMFLRTNAGYRDYENVPGYEHQVGIAVPLLQPETTGLPSSAELPSLSEIEEVLCGLLEQQAESLLVAVITTNGMQEFVFYTRAPQRVEQHIEELRKRITSHEIQLMIQPDATWSVYAKLG